MAYLIKENEPLAPYCSMRVGGNAKYIVLPDSISALGSALRDLAFKGERFIVVGNCSNLVFPDSGFDGAVVVTCGVRGVSCGADGTLEAQCGETLSSLARCARDNSRSGLEFCHGIPGTVGGGAFMNAGAYGGEISQRLTECTVLDNNLEEKTVSAAELGFGYRKSAFADKGYVLLSAKFSTLPGDRNEIAAKMEDLMARRKKSQPLEYPSCGSAFKRPEGYYAGALIEQCGLKGMRVGGAEVSEKHAGFIINRGAATASDILELMRLVRDRVLKNTGVRLEPEIRFIDTEF